MKQRFFLFVLLCLPVIFLQAQTGGENPPEAPPPLLNQTVSPFLANDGCSWRRTTQPFGYADNIGNDGTPKYHTGVDVACRKGAEITAPFTCKLIHVVNSSSNQGWGSNVICKALLPEGKGICFRVAHLVFDSVTGKTGDIVLAGSRLGLEGNTGFSSGVHGHYQLVDCDEEYPLDIDDGYAGGSGGFDQLRRFYNPLRFFAELKNPREIRATLNRVRFESNGAFSGHSWISATPNFVAAEDWENLKINGWERRFQKRSYAGNSNVHYYADYLMTKQDNMFLRVRPYFPRRGTYMLYYKVPDDPDIQNGGVKMKMFFRGHFQKDGEPDMIHEAYVPFNTANRGKYLPFGVLFGCLEGKSCYVEITTQGLGGTRYAGFEELKWIYVSEIYDQLHWAAVVDRDDHFFRVDLPANTEVGSINLISTYDTRNINLDLQVSHRKKDGRLFPLPCHSFSQPDALESCLFLQGDPGDKLEIRIKNRNPPFCCGYAVVIVNNHPVLNQGRSFSPLFSESLFADVGDQDSWYAVWLYKAAAARLLTGVCGTDFDQQTCFYKPERAVTKAELLKMLLSAIGAPNPLPCASNPYSDVDKNAWHCPYVQEFKQKLPTDFIWDGQSPTRFFPDQEVSRELAAFMAFKALGKAKDYDPVRDELIFCDLAASSYKVEIFSLHRFGIVQGFRPDVLPSRCLYNFSPSSILNRAQAAKIAFKVFEYVYHKGL